MTFLNDAYNTLKDPEKRRAWLLQKLNPAPSAKPQVLSDLAATWFDVQDTAETPGEQARQAVTGFQEQLRTARQESQNTIQRLEEEADEALTRGTPPGCDTLSSLRKEILSQATLSSLERDVERLKKRLFIM